MSVIYDWGWHTFCHSISNMHTVGQGPGETPSALRCLSYLINSFLTDIKQLAKTSKGGTLHPPSDVCVRSFLCPLSTLIQLCYTKALEWSSLVPGPEAKSSFSLISNLTLFTVSYHYLLDYSYLLLLELPFDKHSFGTWVSSFFFFLCPFRKVYQHIFSQDFVVTSLAIIFHPTPWSSSQTLVHSTRIGTKLHMWPFLFLSKGSS